MLPLLKALKTPLLVTTTTPTGMTVLAQQALPHVQHKYLPVDLPGACRRFFNSATIQEGWLVETEIWPWLYATTKARQIPLTIINARLSDKTSSQANGLLSQTFKQALAGVRILARSKDDANRFVELGATPTSIRIVGNLKYANVGNDEQINNGRLLDRIYLLAASTHEDEELQLALEWSRQQQYAPNKAALVIVPRHPERGVAIQKQLARHDIPCALRSRGEALESQHTVYIADTLGELQAWYTYAVASFIGGSLIERGGHNMLEAARHSNPIVVGPHTFNFDDMVKTLSEHDALNIAMDVNEVVAFFLAVLDNQDAYAAMAARAKNQAKISEGVLDDYLDALLPGNGRVDSHQHENVLRTTTPDRVQE